MNNHFFQIKHQNEILILYDTFKLCLFHFQGMVHGSQLVIS